MKTHISEEKSKRILLVATSPQGGRPPKFAVALSKRFQVTLITRPGKTYLVSYLQKYPNIEVKHVGPSIENKDIVSQLLFLFSCFLFTLRTKAKLVYCFDGYSIPVGIFNKVLLRRKFICDGSEFFETATEVKKSPVDLALDKVKSVAIRLSDAITVAEPYAQKLIKQNGREATLILNFPIAKFFNPEVKPPQEFYDKYPNAKNKKILGFIGNIRYGLGLFELIEAFSKIQNDNVMLVLVGDVLLSRGPNLTIADIENHCKKYHVEDKVIITGYIEHSTYPSYCKVIDVGVIALQPLSKFWINTSIPIKMLEYVTLGIPFIASDFVSMRKYGEGCGLFINPEDNDELVKAISLLFSDESLYANLRDKCVTKSKMYQWERQEQMLQSLCEHTIRKG